MKTVSRHRKSLVALVVIVLVLGMVVAIAMAQPAPGQGEDGQERQDRRDRGARMMMGMMGGGGTAMSVTDDAVFVLANGMLLKYDVETLELLAQAVLPRPERPERRDREQAPE